MGDSSYPQFCVTGRRLDQRLAELGATRFAPLGEADVELGVVATPWAKQALEHARESLKQSGPPARVTAPVAFDVLAAVHRV